ncbi:hypothetical protein [Frankia sp. Cppng1_Ct_nod]|uniref:hypothetical protein n=1 Tax=Frankia sp. Cppng1_Ct_nod TaxID=2897162 RepID=UPI0020240322|nr:hypothetical protein [Frankia sp. Cppng1_Ct_nod]
MPDHRLPPGRTAVTHTKGSAMDTFLPPSIPTTSYEHLFVDKAWFKIQNLAETHEYKKAAGSSDGAKTYDTTAI